MAARGPRPAARPAAPLAEPVEVLAARARAEANARAAAYLAAHGVLVPGESGPSRVRRLWAFAHQLVDGARPVEGSVEIDW